MAYLPIEDYGLIGNMRTAALVGKNGSIDWLCLPHFDSPSIFGTLVDHEKGGHFQIAPTREGVTRRQMYWPETNVLITRFLSTDGVAEVIDYMPVGLSRDEPGFHQLVRRVEVVRGAMELRMTCRPAFNYARDDHSVRISEGRVVFQSPKCSLGLRSSLPMQRKRSGVETTFTLRRSEKAIFALRALDDAPSECTSLSEDQEDALLNRTVDYWHQWLGQCTYEGRWRKQIYRSALTIKLLTFKPTGALVAAPTCSLPEKIGGVRNWDYRYTWMRDAAFMLYSLLRIGFTEEAGAFTHWLEERCHEREGNPLQIAYGIDGRTDLTEQTLDHLEGYRGSSPVRIGNSAYKQVQLDIYGELMDAIYLYNKYGTPISYELWKELTGLIDWVCETWQRKDKGIWETRGDRQHFVFSKMMCWVAIDRGLRLADKRSFPADRDRWLACRDAIYRDIMKKGWSAERQAFVQYYGGQTLDASNLIMPFVFFMAPSDPRMIKTLEAISRPPAEGGLLSDSLVHRYDTREVADGLPGNEGTFNMCTFWLVQALSRMGQFDRERLSDARLIFEKMLGYANHLDLFAEETGFHGESLGNFPQGLTHLALISAAYNLDRALEGKRYDTA